ncbi:MAG: hypothetical protein LLG00_16850, partial [Planctomycetaceae bacterium]|nr:hypothetical protein [Planctomycetaceae bacterium]
MKLDRLVALLPCHGIEDFDLKRPEEDAQQLLSAWSTLWHPALLATARSLPTWSPADDPPPDPAGCLLIVPDCCLPLLPENWLSEAHNAGACVLKNPSDRAKTLAAAFEATSPSTAVAPELAADFLALGYCHLQVELLTRKLRYSSNLDEAGLRTAALAAADEAMSGNEAAARGHLQAAFDRLHEAREYFYPTTVRLLDLTLLAPGLVGEPLRTALAASMPRNLLCSAATLEELAQREPETLALLQEALTAGRATLLGGEFTELPLPLLDPEAIALQLSRGLASYDRRLGRRPTVFGRRRFGLTPALPQVLERFGFTAAFHCTLDDGRFPAGNQSRIRWESPDGSAAGGSRQCRVPLAV